MRYSSCVLKNADVYNVLESSSNSIPFTTFSRSLLRFHPLCMSMRFWLWFFVVIITITIRFWCMKKKHFARTVCVQTIFVSSASHSLIQWKHVKAHFQFFSHFSLWSIVVISFFSIIIIIYETLSHEWHTLKIRKLHKYGWDVANLWMCTFFSCPLKY